MKLPSAYSFQKAMKISCRRPCCAASGGPGHVHLSNGSYDAHRSGVPAHPQKNPVQMAGQGLIHISKDYLMFIFLPELQLPEQLEQL
jgi:hypothetical protein